MRSKKSSWVFLFLIWLFVISSGLGQEVVGRGEAESVPDEILVKYKTERSQSIGDLESRHKLRKINFFDFIHVYHYKVDPGQKKAILDRLNADMYVAYAEPNYSVYPLEIPNDPRFSEQWGLTKISAPQAWDVVRANNGFDDLNGVTVAVIDTGVDYTHPEFERVFWPAMWLNMGEYPWGNNGLDDDGNGWVDDIYGIDAYNNDGDPMDDAGHGTHCAGIIGAVPNNSLGVSGVCWSPPQGTCGANIMALKFLPSSGTGSTAGAITCINYAIQNGAKVLSNSWGGGGYSQALYDTIAVCRQNNILFIAAAGNDTQNTDAAPEYPASYNLDNIISVAASDANDALASFSNYGPTSVDLAAPGVSILSTIPGAAYNTKSGTSMATPFVSGAVALILSMQENQYMSYTWLKNAILYSADPVPALAGLVLTGGRLNLAKALDYHLQVRLRYPNGGHLLLGTTYAIRWVQFGLSSYHVNIELLQGDQWAGFIARNVPANLAAWDWNVGSVEGGVVGPGDDYKIRIYTADTPIWMGNFGDTSSDPFHLLARISVVSPNGGENWPIGTSHNIVWDQAGLTSNTVNIKLYKDAQFLATIASNYTSASSSYNWKAGDYAGGTAQPGSGYSILVESFANPALSDITDGVFTIAPAVAPGITVTSPNGGESWPMGSAQNITWTSTGGSANVKIEYSTNSGSTYTLIAGWTANDGTHPWTVPLITSSTCLVRVRDASSPSVFDVSNSVFSIVPIPDRRLTWTAGFSENPDIAAQGSNQLHVVWQDDTPGNYEIYYKKSTDGGVNWTAAQKLTSTSGASKNPAVAAETAGRVHLVWEENNAGNLEIYYKKSADGGATWTANKRLTWTSGASSRPEIAVDASSNLHVVWYDNTPGNGEIYYTQSTDKGATWTAARRLTWTSGGSELPALRIDSSDNLHLAWQDNSPGNSEVYYKKSTDGGTTWTANKRLTWTTGSSERPVVGADSAGTLHVAWVDNTPGNTEIYHKRSTNAGVTWDANKRLTWTVLSSYSPDLAVDSSGRVHLVWVDLTPGNPDIYYRKSADMGVTWTTALRLTRTTGLSEAPALGVDTSGNIHLVWQDNTPGNYEIYFLKFH